MEDNMNMRDEIDIKEVEKDPLEGIDKAAAAVILSKVGEAVIKEYSVMQESIKVAEETSVKVDKELDDIEKEVTDINKEIEVQVGVVKTLERRIESEKDENTILSLMVIRDETLEYLQELKDKLEAHAQNIKSIEVSMQKIKNDEVYLSIGSEVLLNFGIKYGLIAKKE